MPLTAKGIIATVAVDRINPRPTTNGSPPQGLFQRPDRSRIPNRTSKRTEETRGVGVRNRQEEIPSTVTGSWESPPPTPSSRCVRFPPPPRWRQPANWGPHCPGIRLTCSDGTPGIPGSTGTTGAATVTVTRARLESMEPSHAAGEQIGSDKSRFGKIGSLRFP